MSVVYRHNFIELYSISGGSAIGDPDLRGIHLNGERPLDARTTRDFTLYVFDSYGNVISTTRYDLYLGVQAGNLNDANRLVATLNALPVGTPFGIVTWDEPSQGHYKNWAGDDYPPLIDAMVRAGADRSLYARPWRQWCAYMLVGKIGEPAYFEKLDETPRPETAPVYANGFIHCKFSIVDNKIVPYRYQNKISARVNSLWKEGQIFYCKSSGVWKAVRKIFVKQNGVWEKIYVRNAFQVMSLGLAQTVIDSIYAPMYLNGSFLAGKSRSYSLLTIDGNGEPIEHRVYDIYVDGGNGGTENITRMINDLNALPIDQLFIIVTFDEPMAGHLNGGLPEAMYRIGATPEVFGQPMAYRGAYMLLGKVGRTAYFEKYIGELVGDGDFGGDPNAAIYKLFTVDQNEIIILPEDWNWYDSVPSLGNPI